MRELKLQKPVSAGVEESDILAVYKRWSAATGKAGFTNLDECVMPNSDFMEITGNCMKLNDLDIKCRYEFSDMKVLNVCDTCKQARIWGKVKLNVSGSKIGYLGTFSSRCMKRKSSGGEFVWKLCDIRIDWE
ncbi:MAG: hypothetical protein JXA03_13640 [Bacteroidales bacterium]|nr:hypothetical protein [Bacteroidales bacterium]